MNPYIIYDIETYRSDRLGEYINQKNIKPAANLVDPLKIEADIVKRKAAIVDKAALSPITGRITCMGISYCGDFKFFINKDEKDLLTDIDTFIAGKEVSSFVGKNCLDFDLPYLRVRHLVHKLPMPAWLRPTCRHTDIKSYFGRGAMGQYGPSMADLEFVMDIQRDGQKDALQCFEWWEQGDWASLELYNEQDVRTTESIYLMVENH